MLKVNARACGPTCVLGFSVCTAINKQSKQNKNSKIMTDKFTSYNFCITTVSQVDIPARVSVSYVASLQWGVKEATCVLSYSRIHDFSQRVKGGSPPPSGLSFAWCGFKTIKCFDLLTTTPLQYELAKNTDWMQYLHIMQGWTQDFRKE